MKNDKIKTDGYFNFFVSCDIDGNCLEKAKKDKDGYPDELLIYGVASTDDEDSDGEVLEPNGYDLNRFLKKGYLNLEHMSKNDMKYIVGEPVDAYVKDNKLFIKGKLYKSNPLARNIYDTIKMLKEEGSNRQIGFSIEGKALQRHPHNKKRITKAMITNCAITQSAKNQNTWADIVKGEQSNDFENIEANGGQTYLLDVTTDKGMRVTIDKDFNIKVNKSMSTVSGAPLMKESVDGVTNKKKKKDAVKELPVDFIKNLDVINKAIEQGTINEATKEKIKSKIDSILY